MSVELENEIKAGEIKLIIGILSAALFLMFISYCFKQVAQSNECKEKSCSTGKPMLVESKCICVEIAK